MLNILERTLARIVRLPGVRSLWLRCPIGSVRRRVSFDIWARPQYAYGVYSAAQLAQALGLPGISVAEFGVAGGTGLLALEKIAREVSQALNYRIDVYGFDAGTGMPEASDYRDLPHVWAKGFYKMDVDRLKARLTTAELILGDVARTSVEFISRGDVMPVGFIGFDLDYYSSTVHALRVFDGPTGTRLPRVLCYFDDVIWPEHAYYNDFVGELLAINEFNEAHRGRKICRIHLLRHTRLNQAPWNDQMYVMHDFEHPLYCLNLTPKDNTGAQLALR